MELASTIVAIMLSYLRSGRSRPPEGGPGQDAARTLYSLVAGRLADDGALRALVQETAAGTPRPRTRQRVQLALEDALDADPQFAGQLSDLVRRAGAEQTTAGGTSSNVTRQQVAQDHLRAGRDIRTSVTSRSKNTKIAIGGGGALLAAALLFVWFQYSSGKSAADERTAYQKGVLAACDRIRQTGTGQLDPDVSADGLRFHRGDLETLLSTNRTVVRSQVDSLVSRPAPPGLDDERAAVRQAAASFAARYPAALAATGQLPETFSLEALRRTSGDPRFVGWTDAYRDLGDALTRLGGSTCSIEFQARQS